MKFLVLCTIEPRRADAQARQSAMDALVAAGFKPVGSECVGGLRYGMPDCALGEFRALTPEVLRRRIESDLTLRFASRKLEVGFQLCVNAVSDAQDSRNGMAV